MGFLTFIDGNGITRLISGWLPGSYNDINAWYLSEYFDKQDEYFGDAMALFDGIYRYVSGPFICAFANPCNDEKLILNLLHILSRSTIEHVYGRQKLYWPIIGTTYTLALKWIGIIYRCCAILTNILVIHQSPMR